MGREVCEPSRAVSEPASATKLSPVRFAYPQTRPQRRVGIETVALPEDGLTVSIVAGGA